MRTLVILLGVILLSQLCFGQVQASDTVPTPEPGTVLLMGTGLAGLVFAVWRRNRPN